jgi:hypothetical protein
MIWNSLQGAGLELISERNIDDIAAARSQTAASPGLRRCAMLRARKRLFAIPDNLQAQ